MTKLIPRSIGALLAIASTFAFASPASAQSHPDKPLLWKVSGKELKQPSYLFGTIHVGGPHLKDLHPAAQKAFDESETLHTELLMDPKSMMAATQLLMRSDGKTLAESIGEKESARLDAALKRINPALDATPFQAMSTWAIGVTLPLLPEQLKGHTAIDIVLAQKAAAAGKKNIGIETMEQQTKVFSSLTEEEQTQMLSATLDSLEEAAEKGEDPIAEIREPYIKGDAEALQKVMDKSFEENTAPKELTAKVKKALIDDRDKSMADHILATLKENPEISQFIAVGAGHYTSEKSIIHYLKDAGYEVTRIEE